MKKLFATICLSLILSRSYSQRIGEVKYQSQADIKVWIAPYESMADLSVYLTPYENSMLGNHGHWYMCHYSNQSDCKVFFVKNKSEADLIIYFVKYPSQAGWRNDKIKFDLYHF